MRGLQHLMVIPLVACSSSGYEVLVHLPPERPAACRVEVSLLESCSDLEEVSDSARDPVRTVTLTEQGAPAFGDLRAGNYGLHARAFDCECTLLAAGCERVYIEGGGKGRIEVSLVAMEPEGCPSDELCTGGVCVPTDAGEDDAGEVDAGQSDASTGATDAGETDASTGATDAGEVDAAADSLDAGTDAGI